MQVVLDILASLKHGILSRLGWSASPTRWTSRGMAASRMATSGMAASGMAASGGAADATAGSDMKIIIGRPPDIPPPPLFNLNSNHESVSLPSGEGIVDSDTKELLKEFGLRAIHSALTLAVTMWIAKRLLQWAVDAMDPTHKEKQEAQDRADQLLDQIGIKGIRLNELELALAANLVNPASIRVGFDDVGGLNEVVTDLGETVILPLKNAALFHNSKLLQPPKGVLLYGPPGCGKTMIAKATAREAGARFLNINLSSLLDKWYGESQKRVEALFTLAVKIQPTIIFIDEMDSILRNRSSNDHEATAMMKTQFMSLWDGLSTDTYSCRVIIMGATNRPSDLDEAIMRRMPLKFYIGMPNQIQRNSILKIILEDENVNDDVDLDAIAEQTVNFSGSDLKELCRNASGYRVREFIRSKAGDWRCMTNPSNSNNSSNSSSNSTEWHECNTNPLAQAERFRSISNSDLILSAKQMANNRHKSTLAPLLMPPALD